MQGPATSPENISPSHLSAGVTPSSPSASIDDVLDTVIEQTVVDLKSLQSEDGHWVFDLEADATIPAEYILLEHFLDEIDDEVEAKLAGYLRKIQLPSGGWPLFADGDPDLSASVKAYFALKLVGDDPDATHMAKARTYILDAGGAAHCNVFTRITLALFGEVPWRAVPVMPIEIMLLPRWFPFHLSKVSYWSRTVMVPLLLLMQHRPKALNPRGVTITELFTIPPAEERDYLVNHSGSLLGRLFLHLDGILRLTQPYFPRRWRKSAEKKAIKFVTERLNGEDGLGGIFPAMANAVMAFRTLGYPDDHPDVVTAKSSVRKLVVDDGETGFCQPCVSPVWDTGLALHALLEAGESGSSAAMAKAQEWLVEKQILETRGDWTATRPDLRPGGWPFQYANDFYPDTDDSAVVVMALDRAGQPASKEAIERGIEWILGMQSKNGGWGAFDADNTHYHLNRIPFADHGALLDPPSADVTARCVGLLAQSGMSRDDTPVARGIDFLYREQESDGSWFGRWGTNYVYGTWSVLCALNAVGEDPSSPPIRKAVEWLKSQQRDDGGWGEDCSTYWPDRRGESTESTPSQTAWALLGLMAAGEIESEAVQRGIAWLLNAPRSDGKWDERLYNAVGFPRVFYLTYHGYSIYFPLWALARYRRLKDSNTRVTPHGV